MITTAPPTGLWRWETLAHLLFWLVYFFYPFITYSGDAYFKFDWAKSLFLQAVALLLVYFVYALWLPKGWFRTVGGLVLLISLIPALAWLYCEVSIYFSGCNCSVKNCFLSYSGNFTTLSLFFTGVYSVKRNYLHQLQIDNIRQEKLRAELEGLKAQVNPHFLFNTLHTIYAYSLTHPEKAPPLILQLADMLKYMLYEGQKEFTTLAQEWQHIENYVGLQQSRLGDALEVELQNQLASPQRQLAPLLLVSFVENAFKYTSLLGGKGHRITIHCWEEGNTFHFYCANPFHPQAYADVDKQWLHSGIGLANTRQRLAYLYPNRHQLEIQTQDQQFTVHLALAL